MLDDKQRQDARTKVGTPADSEKRLKGGLTMSAGDLKVEIDDLYASYAEAICDDELERWPDFFTEECLYRVIQRSNHERGMLLGPIFSENRGGLIDRVTAIRNALVYAPRYLCYVVGTIRMVECDGTIAKTRSMFSAYHTVGSGDSELLMVGRSFDEVVLGGDALKFSQRVVVFDTERIPGALIYPV